MAVYGVPIYGQDTYGQAGQEVTYLNEIALLVGGTQPDPVNNPFFYSGSKTGDGTGLSGDYGRIKYGGNKYGPVSGVGLIKGCYSRPPFVVEEAPCGIVFTGQFRAGLDMQLERQDDRYRLVILVKKIDSRSDFAILNTFRDLVPALFRKHLTLFGSYSVLQAYVSDGRALGMDYAGENWWAWEFTVHVIRLPRVVYRNK